MKAFIDRIENGRIAVVHLERGGKLEIDKKIFPFEIHEGMHIKISLSPDSESEKRSKKKIKKYKKRLSGS
ncbi:MAG: DUF3006 family protein [Elusimicrobiota bacterium]